MNSECETFKCSGLSMDDCKKSNGNISIQEWKRIQGEINKHSKSVSMEDDIKLFNKYLVILKRHIHVKRIQNAELNRIKDNLHSNELLFKVNYAEWCENAEQNEIQIGCFGYETFSIFTAMCLLRGENNENIAIISEANDHSRIMRTPVRKKSLTWLETNTMNCSAQI